MSKAVLSEIVRLEGELARIQRELQALRVRVDGTGRKTQALAAFKTQPPPALHSSDTQHTEDLGMSATLPPPAHRDPKSHETLATPGAPAPSRGSVSEVVATDGRSSRGSDPGESRRSEGGRVGLSAPPPPHTNATPTRRSAAVDPDAGRYVTVGEGRSRRR